MTSYFEKLTRRAFGRQEPLAIAAAPSRNTIEDPFESVAEPQPTTVASPPHSAPEPEVKVMTRELSPRAAEESRPAPARPMIEEERRPERIEREVHVETRVISAPAKEVTGNLPALAETPRAHEAPQPAPAPPKIEHRVQPRAEHTEPRAVARDPTPRRTRESAGPSQPQLQPPQRPLPQQLRPASAEPRKLVINRIQVEVIDRPVRQKSPAPARTSGAKKKVVARALKRPTSPSGLGQV